MRSSGGALVVLFDGSRCSTERRRSQLTKKLRAGTNSPGAGCDALRLGLVRSRTALTLSSRFMAWEDLVDPVGCSDGGRGAILAVLLSANHVGSVIGTRGHGFSCASWD